MKRQLIAGLTFVFGLVLSACGGEGGGGGGATAEPNQQLAPTAVQGDATDARAIIGVAVNKWNMSGPYKLRITSSLPDSPPADMFIVPPDSSRFVQTLADGSRFETIKIGPANYSFVNGEWTATTSEAIQLDTPVWTDPAALNEIQDIQSLGTKDVNGVGASGYSFTDASAPGETNTLWIGPNGAPVQVISVNADETLTYDIVYDAAITISPPGK